ncbi:hypothetical protein MMC17_009707 [Xylographa soralifera]|nr:hypothetical protein [Xylographa soralifera]
MELQGEKLAARSPYESLARDHVRMLQVTIDGPALKGRLESFHIDRLPYFVALSYAWPVETVSGTAGLVRALECNGSTIAISDYLHTALSCLVPEAVASSVSIWIDAISIDQSDPSEVAMQVQLMGAIYTRASCVIVWLGTGSVADDLSRNICTVEEIKSNVRVTKGTLTKQQLNAPPFPKQHHPVWDALTSLLFSRWFRRLWVVQEALLAKKLEIVCGRCSIDWDDFYTLVDAELQTMADYETLRECMDRQGWAYLSLTDASSSMGAITFYRGQVARKGPFLNNIISFLEVIREKEVLKPIDKVYSILALITDEARQSLTVDYSLQDQFWIPYLQLAGFLVTQDRCLQLLSAAQSVVKPEGLPSWCPNWNSVMPVSHILAAVRPRGWNGDQVRFGYRAGISSTTSLPQTLRLKRSTQLEVTGFRIDRIKDSIYLADQIHRGRFEIAICENAFRKEWLLQNEACLERTRQLIKDPSIALQTHVRNLTMNYWDIEFDLIAPISPDHWPIVLQAYSDLVNISRHFVYGTEFENSDSPIRLRALEVMNSSAAMNGAARPYFFTQNGRIGRGPVGIQQNDLICVLYSAPAPFVLRYDNESNVAKLIGDAYLDECMDFDSMPTKGRCPEEIFTIG